MGANLSYYHANIALVVNNRSQIDGMKSLNEKFLSIMVEILRHLMMMMFGHART